MGASAVLVALTLAAAGLGQTLSQDDIATQNKLFRSWWNEDIELKFDELPVKGGVPETRVPYSGYIYPDTAGGTIGAMRKYDSAYHRGQYLASKFEQWDTTAFRKTTYSRRRVGLFRWRNVSVSRTPHWHGHCNGWAAAAIRHAEPQQSVVRNGVTFTPADIKALLAEIYIYSYPEMLAGEDKYVVDPATFHLIVTNWLGRKTYPVAMEAAPGEEKWNYPIYKYEAETYPRGNGQVEVTMTITFANNLNQEYHQAPRFAATKWFHYLLNLDEAGKVTGGSYYNNSSQVDMLWTPRPPIQGGQPGNDRGNPHVDVNEVLAIWSASVPESLRTAWLDAQPRAEEPVEQLADDAAATAAAAVAAAEEAVNAAAAAAAAAAVPRPAATEDPPAPVTTNANPPEEGD